MSLSESEGKLNRNLNNIFYIRHLCTLQIYYKKIFIHYTRMSSVKKRIFVFILFLKHFKYTIDLERIELLDKLSFAKVFRSLLLGIFHQLGKYC